MSAADTLYTARFAGPELLERGRLNRITCPVHRSGALVAPTETGSTVAIYKPDGSALLGPVQVTDVTGSMAVHDVAAGTLTTSVELAEGYLVEWALIMPDGVTHTFRRACAVGRRRLYPVVTDDDLLRRHSDLADLRPSSQTSYQNQLDEAWEEIVTLLRQGGSIAHLVTSPEEFRRAHLYKTLELIFDDFSISQAAEAKWAAEAKKYEKRFGVAWSGLTLKYDANEDGMPDQTARPAQPVTFLADSGEGDWY